MSRPKTKESTLKCFRLDTNIINRLESYSKITKISMTSVVETALTMYLDNFKNEEVMAIPTDEATAMPPEYPVVEVNE